MMNKFAIQLLIIGAFLCLLSSCSEPLQGEALRAYLYAPEHALSHQVSTQNGQIYNLTYNPISSQENDLIYFELSSKDGKGLYAFSEYNFEQKVNGVYITSSLVVPENYGSARNRLLIGFSKNLEQETMEIKFIPNSSESKSLRYSVPAIKKINQTLSK